MGHRESDYMEIAENLRTSGYNCAQTVACTFSSEIGVDRTVLYRISEGFGSGMGGNDGTCGALSGAIMVLSFLLSSGDPAVPSKQDTYHWIKSFHNTWSERFGSPICSVIKGNDTGVPLYECDKLIRETVHMTFQTIQDIGEYYAELQLSHTDESTVR